MTSASPLPVLVSGAGPTGLTLALTLRHHGIKVRLIDRAPATASVSKALAVWSGSLEALAGLGVVERFLAAGARLDALRVGDGRRELAALKVGEGIDSPYPFPLLLPQSTSEAILAERGAELGVTVERGVELVGFEQDDAGVEATLKHQDGALETVRASFLVGADGARSFVRQTLGVAFEGYTEPQTYLLGDVEIEGGLDHRSIYVWWHGGGTVALFPFGDVTWRMFAVRPQEGDAQPSVAELQEHMDRHGPPGMRLHSPTWLSAFRINERLAAHYRQGHVFLAGDAAHIHSPAGGQGMNTGMQDAVNLGWKLAAVLLGRGDAELLLDSYEAERRPTARAVIAGAAQKLHAAFSGGTVSRILRDVAVTVIGNIPAAQRALQVELSETEVTYREGPLVALGDPPERPRRTDVGSRARDARFRDPESAAERQLWDVLAGPRHTLLVFEESPGALPLDGLADRRGEGLVTLRLDRQSDPDGAARTRYHAPSPGWVLVRPDQVVAARGGAQDLPRLANYLDRVLGPRHRTEADALAPEAANS